MNNDREQLLKSIKKAGQGSFTLQFAGEIFFVLLIMAVIVYKLWKQKTSNLVWL